jgi:hypothetical protein
MSHTAYIIPFDHQSSNTQITDGVDASKLWSLTPQSKDLPKVGTTRIFYNTPPSKVTSVSSLGEGYTSKKSQVKRELVRKSVGSAVKELKALDGLTEVLIDASADPHAAGVLLSHSALYIPKSTVFFFSCGRPSCFIHVYLENISAIPFRSQSDTSYPRKNFIGPSPRFQRMGQRRHLCSGAEPRSHGIFFLSSHMADELIKMIYSSWNYQLIY